MNLVTDKMRTAPKFTDFSFVANPPLSPQSEDGTLKFSVGAQL